MHPNVQKDNPGMCPECGMKLLPQKEHKSSHQEHNKHEGHSLQMFIKKYGGWIFTRGVFVAVNAMAMRSKKI